MTSLDYAGFHKFQPAEGAPFGSFEVFYMSWSETDPGTEGWYWWACSPGCIPDGEAVGPFDTAEDAWGSAQDG